jgi:hypothetical protein
MNKNYLPKRDGAALYEKIGQMHKTFLRLMGPKVRAAYLKEAKRAGYQIEKDLFTFTVRDNGALVFKGVAIRSAVWAVTFSKDYWQGERKGSIPC